MESSVPGCLAGLEIHGFHTLEELDIEKIKEEATGRWLRSNEIHAILCNYTYFNINVKPLNLPESGTIVLYDRRKLRNFRKDGHNWKKKKDGKTVKEAHEHLKVGNEERIHVYYAHGEENPHFVRRLYWLLDRKHEHIVLVHYRETLEENANSPQSTRKDCKEALSLSNRSNLHPTSPLTPANYSSGSGNSDKPGSIVTYEEIDSGPGLQICTGVGASPATESTARLNQLLGTADIRNHELTLHEINTLEWEDLLQIHTSDGCVAPRNEEEALCSGQQIQYELDGGSNDILQRVLQDSAKEISSLGHSTRTCSRTGPMGYEEASKVYSHSVQDQTIQPPLSGTLDTEILREDFEMVPTGTIQKEGFTKDGLLQKEDSFGRWFNSVIDDSPGSLDDLHTEYPDSNNHGPGAVMMMEQPSFQEQVFTITEVSPAWAFAEEETKVIVTGYFLEAHRHLGEFNLYCSIGELLVPVEIVQVGVFRCMVRPHTPGLVNLYLTFDGDTPISQVLNFEYRLLPSYQLPDRPSPRGARKSKLEDFEIQIRLAHLLFSTTKIMDIFTSKISPNALKEARKFLSVASSYDKDWRYLTKSMESNEISVSEAYQNLLELTLKCKLQEWLFERVVEGSKITARDHQGQGVIHLCAILGYSWAIHPISRSGLSIDFRDAFGWTALHWAAYCGREKMVAVLLSGGANPSLVTDPTHENPGGCTAADLASKKGYEGLSAYLAEKALTAHFEAMNLSGKLSASLPPSSPVMEQSENLTEEQLCWKESLAAIRTATDAASRIQAAFRERSLKTQTKAIQLAKAEDEARPIIAALQIQHAFRRYSEKRRMLAAAQIQHSFRTWKIRREFLNIRRHAIKIQAVYRGHLVRRQYRKILWSVGVLEKAVLRWRLKRKGLRGIQVDPATEPVMMEQNTEDNAEEDFFMISRKHAEERVERSAVRVQTMFRSHRARAEYRRMKMCFDQAKLEFDELPNPDQSQ